MQTISRSRTLSLCLLALTAAAGSASAATVFSDNFAASTVQGTSTPGTNSTSYDFAGSKAVTASIAANDLKFSLPASSSAIAEAQAVFTGSPITLSAVGDYVKFNMNFTNTAGTPAAVYFGLFKSGGTKPALDLNTGSMTSGFTNDATGFVQNWVGYSSQLKTASSAFSTRPAQAGTSNTSQDLLSNAASSSQSYAGGTNLGSIATTVNPTLAAGSSYFEDYTITLTAAGTYTLTSFLYQGNDATGTLVGSSQVTDSTFLYNGFDALAFGIRETNSVAPTIDVASLSVSTNTPEPSVFGLLAMGGVLGLSRRRV